MSTNPMTQTNPLQAAAKVEQRHIDLARELHGTPGYALSGDGWITNAAAKIARHERDYLATEIRKLKGSEA